MVPRTSGQIVPNERLQNGDGGSTVYIDATGADAAAIRRLELALQQQARSVDSQATAAVQRAFQRMPSFGSR
jgi:glycerate kinase